MSRIEETFTRLQDRGEKPFIPFLMAGDPDLETSKKLILETDRRGADIIEIGIPYSTPLADGPTIKAAGQRSLKHNTNLNDIFELVSEIRAESEVPLILMGYYNPVFNYGIEEFVADCEKMGVDGVIIPDLPVGEDKELRAKSNSLDIISLVAPVSTEDRIKKAADMSQGFIYAVSTLGTTGARGEVSHRVEAVVNQVKKLTSTPVAVGFGISNPEHVKEVAEFSDGVIVGSAIIKRIESYLGNKERLIDEVGEFVSRLKAPIS